MEGPHGGTSASSWNDTCLRDGLQKDLRPEREGREEEAAHPCR